VLLGKHQVEEDRTVQSPNVCLCERYDLAS
jgi:hypothetical protein